MQDIHLVYCLTDPEQVVQGKRYNLRLAPDGGDERDGHTMSHFNAILVGGPPHSGKSVLTYSLTSALRKRGIEHYVVRACPDGEGDWSNEAHPDTVKLIRQKGRFTPEFVEQITVDLGSRHLPLLVDVGGKPQPDQEVIFAQCTHAVLIARDEEALAEWRAIARRNGLSVVAELISDLQAEPAVLAAGEPFCARLNGLERNHSVEGPVFDALVERLATYLFEPSAALRRQHLDSAPTELSVDIQDLAQQIHVAGEPSHWLPEHLPLVLSYLPSGVSVGLYGRGPNWLFAATAAHAYPAAFYLFDVRLGWITPSRVVVASDVPDQPVLFAAVQSAGSIQLQVQTPGYYLEYAECRQVVAPMLPAGQAVIVSGRIPHWLMTGVVLAYHSQPWVAVYQPQLRERAVVVWAQADRPNVGDLVTMSEPTGAG